MQATWVSMVCTHGLHVKGLGMPDLSKCVIMYFKYRIKAKNVAALIFKLTKAFSWY